MRVGIKPAMVGDAEERLKSRGVSRRDFLKFCTAVAVGMGMGPAFAPEVARALAARKPSIIYVHNAECTGCTEALLRTYEPYIDELILDVLSIDYQETIMAAAGEAAEDALEKAMKNPDGFICVMEGAIPTALNGDYGYVAGRTMLEACSHILPKAKAIIACGSCASYGGVQAAKPNPTGAKGVNECFKGKAALNVVNVPGCPPNPLNLVGTIVAILQGKEIKLDSQGRPEMFYGESVHDLCPRRKHFDANELAPSFNSEEARKGWCLFDLGCKGPQTMNNCPKALFNGTNWPVGAGHPCIGCSEPNFWDNMSPFYES